jgi:pimeloyl-ACP methyl ester carboxylesterase
MPARPRPALAAALVAVALATSACTDDGSGGSAPTTTAGDTTTTESSAPFEPAPLQWRPCNGIECATMAVPVDYTAPEGPTIELALVRVPANDQERRLGSLVVNPGGPGASGVDYVGTGQVFDEDVHDRFDVIGFDPRGTGQSAALTCGGDLVELFRDLDPAPDSAAEQAALEDGAEAIADDCAAKDAALLPHIGTVDVVRDLETLRKALGEDEITYVGHSYGTLIGQRYAERYPDSVRAMVLDGVVDPADDMSEFLRAQVGAFDRAVDTMFEACEGDPTCPSIGAARAFELLATDVEDAPIDAGGDGAGPAELVTATIYATYLPTLWPSLYAAYETALDGDGRGLVQLSEAYRSSFGAYTSYIGVTCIDGPHPEGSDGFQALAAELAELSPRLGAAIVNELLPCAYWPAPPASDPRAVERPGTPPVLVIGTAGDPATPYEQAQRVTERLGDAVLLTYQGEGHGALRRSACVDDAVTRYLEDLELPDPGTICH